MNFGIFDVKRSDRFSSETVALCRTTGPIDEFYVKKIRLLFWASLGLARGKGEGRSFCDWPLRSGGESGGRPIRRWPSTNHNIPFFFFNETQSIDSTAVNGHWSPI